MGLSHFPVIAHQQRGKVASFSPFLMLNLLTKEKISYIIFFINFKIKRYENPFFAHI
jgi:hypothetical protein